MGAAYLLGVYRQMLLGPETEIKGARFWDLDKREILCAAPLLVFVIWLGLYPKPFLTLIDASAKHLLVQAAGG